MSGDDHPGAELAFTWNPTKAASNLIKHGIAFDRAAAVFADALALTVFDTEHSDFEERWFTARHGRQRQAAGDISYLHGHGASQRAGENHFGA